MRCPLCGNEVRDTAKFCPYCGNELTQAAGPGTGTTVPEARKKSSKKVLLIVLPAAGTLLTALVIVGILAVRGTFSGNADSKTQAPAVITIPAPEETTARETEPSAEAEASEETLEPTAEETAAAENTETETEIPTESASESVETETEILLTPLEEQMVGFWVGDLASEYTLRADGTCFYQEPQNMNNERVRNGVECEWCIIGDRMMIVGAADYIIYGVLDPEGDNSEVTVVSDNAAWNTETFVKQY